MYVKQQMVFIIKGQQVRGSLLCKFKAAYFWILDPPLPGPRWEPLWWLWGNVLLLLGLLDTWFFLLNKSIVDILCFLSTDNKHLAVFHSSKMLANFSGYIDLHFLFL